MGKRLYWGALLRGVHYHPAYKGKPERFSVWVEKAHYDEVPTGRKAMPQISDFETQTLDDLYQQLKAAGYQIWGKDDYLSYAYRPKNAFEYMLIKDVLKMQGYSEDTIANMFSLDSLVKDKTEQE